MTTIDPTNADAHYYIGRIAEERGDTTALQCYHDAFQLDREQKTLWVRMQKLQPFAAKKHSLEIENEPSLKVRHPPQTHRSALLATGSGVVPQ